VIRQRLDFRRGVRLDRILGDPGHCELLAFAAENGWVDVEAAERECGVLDAQDKLAALVGSRWLEELPVDLDRPEARAEYRTTLWALPIGRALAAHRRQGGQAK
jgi:hypothetical protein